MNDMLSLAAMPADGDIDGDIADDAPISVFSAVYCEDAFLG